MVRAVKIKSTAILTTSSYYDDYDWGCAEKNKRRHRWHRTGTLVKCREIQHGGVKSVVSWFLTHVRVTVNQQFHIQLLPKANKDSTSCPLHSHFTQHYPQEQ